MPYYVFRITAGPTSIVKNLELLDEFEAFKQAKTFAKEHRTNQAENDDSQIKVMFAENRLQAEELLQEKKDKPIVREWEK